MSVTTKQRDYLFDNYKVLLILLVVIGHFIEPCYKNNDILFSLKWIIFSFHMPAFIFISGYFSKRELPFMTVVRKLAVPYIACELIYYFFYVLALHKDTGLYLTRPKFSLWYLLALFVWRAATPYVKRIPHYMILAVIGGLLIGCSGMPSNFLSIPRILYFYPFFLAGINFNRETLTRLRTRSLRLASALGLTASVLFAAFCPLLRVFTVKVFYGRYSYHTMGLNYAEGILSRLLCYGISFAMTFAVMILISERKTRYSYMGTRTMAVYLFHGLTYTFLKSYTPLLGNVDTVLETFLLLACCVAVTVVFSAQPFTTFTNQFSNAPLPELPKPENIWRPNIYLQQVLCNVKV